MIKIGILLKWKRPSSESSYDTVRVHRANGQNETYAQIASQTITDNSYYDNTGNGSHWYKIDFYDSVNGIASNYSSTIQGGEWEGYATVDEIRTVTNIKPNQITDTALANLIEFAAAQLNSDINVYHYKEKVAYINETKENDIDGTNIKYYAQHFPIGDMNNDYQVTVSDLKAYEVDSDGLEQEITVVSVNAETGEFRLNAAPTSDKRIYVTYNSTQLVIDPPHKLIKMACILLTAAWSYSKINTGKATRFRFGNNTVFRDMDADNKYMMKYIKLVTGINDRSIVNIAQAEDLI